MLKLRLQYFGHLMRRTDSLVKNLMLGKLQIGRRRERQKMRWLDGITYLMDMSWVNSGSWWWTGKPDVLQSMGSQRVKHDWVTELNWTELDQFLTFPDLHSSKAHSFCWMKRQISVLGNMAEYFTGSFCLKTNVVDKADLNTHIFGGGGFPVRKGNL